MPTSLRSAYLFAYLPTSLPPYLHTYLPTYLPTCLPTYTLTFYLPIYLQEMKKQSQQSQKTIILKKKIFVIACYWKQKIYKCKLYFKNSQFRDIECEHEKLCKRADSSPYSIIFELLFDFSVFNLQNIQKIRKLF